MAIVYLGIGSNIGDRESNCNEAVKRLQTIEDVEIIESSKLYITCPAGGPPQRDYLNGVLKIDTVILPDKLLTILKEIEKDMGREILDQRNTPRIIDIDILLYNDKIIESDELVIPHPRLHERYFVLHGLCEIAADLVHPVLGKTIEELYRGVIDKD